MKMQTSLGFVPLVILFLKLSPSALAIDPPPDGGYPGGNTAEAQNALLSLTSGMYNTAVGFDSLVLNAAGNFNTGVGAGALLTNVGDPTTGDGVENTAIGAGALLSNSAGSRNTAIGAFALFNNIGGDGADGSLNTAVGDSALLNNTTGGSNIAIGHDALHSNTEGFNNVADGNVALYSNTTGHKTRQSVFLHWLSTSPATTTRPWAFKLATRSQAMATSVLGRESKARLVSMTRRIFAMLTLSSRILAQVLTITSRSD